MSNYTKANKVRIDGFRNIGCIVTRLYFEDYADYDCHHITDCGRRMGNAFVIPLSPWYHRAVPPSGMTERRAYLELGPTLEKHKKEFIGRFGSEIYLLEQTNKLLDTVSTNY